MTAGGERLRIAMVGLRAVGEGCSGGVEAHVDALAPRLAAMGHHVTVFCRSPYAKHLSGTYRGVKIRPLPCIRTKHLEAVTNTLLASMAASTGFDVVHFHAVGPSLFSWIPRLAGARIVATVHGLDHRRAKWGRLARAALGAGVRAAITFPHATIVVSPALRGYFARTYDAATTYIPNGVERPASLQDSGALPDCLTRHGVREPGYVLSLGRLVPEKGLHDLIGAYARLDTTRQLVIVGGGSHSSAYEREMRKMASADPRVIFTGPLYGEDKARAYAAACLFVLPSTVEGMPITLLEASSHGCASLISDIPESTSVFDGAPHALGGKCRAGDADSLARSLRKLLDQDGALVLEDVGARAKDWVLLRYNWDHIAEQVLSTYRAVLAR